MTKCQTPNCQNKAEFQHILKLGSVNIAKQWVCSDCREELERKEELKNNSPSSCVKEQETKK